MSTKDALLEALGEAPPPKLVSTGVPALAGKVFAKCWTAQDGIDFSEAVDEIDDANVINAQLLARTICDDGGTLMFTPAEAAGLPSTNGPLWAKLLQAARKANGFGDEEDTEKTQASRRANPATPDVGVAMRDALPAGIVPEDKLAGVA